MGHANHPDATFRSSSGRIKFPFEALHVSFCVHLLLSPQYVFLKEEVHFSNFAGGIDQYDTATQIWLLIEQIEQPHSVL